MNPLDAFIDRQRIRRKMPPLDVMAAGGMENDLFLADLAGDRKEVRRLKSAIMALLPGQTAVDPRYGEKAQFVTFAPSDLVPMSERFGKRTAAACSSK